MKRILLVSIMCLIISNFIGCKNNTQNIVNQIQNEKQIEITLYFPNKAYVNTGDELLAKILPEKRLVSIGNKIKEKVIVEELLKGPNGINLDKLSDKLKLIDVKVQDGTAFVDFKGEGLSGGSLEEELAVDSIVNSLTEDINIKQVQFLIDGKVVETLMGHIDTSKPIGRKDVK